ncbi:MAG: hypothetical protein WC942_01420 [Clostridia bacterium]
MNKSDLDKELIRKIFIDLGACPKSIGKAGITHRDFLVKNILKIDDGTVHKEIPTWYGELRGSEGIMCCLLSALDFNIESLEVLFVLGFKDFDGNIQEDAIRFGLYYDWSAYDSIGLFMTKVKSTWVPVFLAQKLQIALGMEIMVQEGSAWVSGVPVPEEFKKNISELLNELD